jgi:aromatic ring-opening dioxygenase catalytic subunit (LigB family)
VYTGIVKWPYAPEYRNELWYPDERKDYPVAAPLARHVISQLVEHGFDISYSRQCRDGHGMSHSFAFVYWRLMRGKRTIPVIPVNINTYFPPNQVPPPRCYALGQALSAAIAAWPQDLRVLVIATGGLSHFVVDEKLDRGFIDALASRDAERIYDMPPALLQGGNSEFRNWITLGGAVSHLGSMDVIDYVPCYRSAAGTGCAMGFIHWC